MLLHFLFDLAAVASGFLSGLIVRHWRSAVPAPEPWRGETRYWLVAVFGALFGAFALGTANMLLSGEAAPARSVLGAIVGGVLAVEAYKWRQGITRSTGVALVLPLTVGIAVGRVGCFLSGLDDFTYGTPTDLAWGRDFGDGIHRHPVQLYETLAMLLFALAFVNLLWRKPDFVARRGFYLFCVFYGGERFLLELLKPYATVLGPLNLFQFACLLLLFYGLAMMRYMGDRRADPATIRLS